MFKGHPTRPPIQKGRTLHTINLQDQTITYQLRKTWRNKYIRLTIHPQKGLVISAPQLCPHSQIEKFINEKAYWINSKLKILQSQQQNIFQFGHDQLVTLLGKDHRIQIIDNGSIVPKIDFIPFPDHTQPLLQKEEGDAHPLTISSPLGNLKTAEQHFFKWLKRFTQKTIENKVHFYSQKYGLKINRITIKNQQTLWGSCSAKQNLNFSKRLIQAPIWLIDYVICHELAHLIHMNHSQKFWSKVGEYYPGYKKARRHLKAYQPNVVIR